MIRGAIFDLDGTLTDSMPIWETIGEEYLCSRGIEPPADLRDTLAPLSMKQTIVYFREVLGLRESEREIYDGINAMVEDLYFHEVPLKAGAGNVLHRLRESGVRCAVATAQERYLTEAALQRLGVLDCFDVIVTCTEIGVGKDQPDVFECARELLGVEKEQAVVFEDAPHAIQTAIRAGFRVVAVQDASAAKYEQVLRELSEQYLCTYDECEVERL